MKTGGEAGKFSDRINKIKMILKAGEFLLS
jgi:hypothetical protein